MNRQHLGFGIGAAVVALVVAHVDGQRPRGQNETPPEVVQATVDNPVPARPAPVPSKTWTPKRRPDGQPDVEGGLWGAVGPGTHNPLENPTGGAKPVPSRISDPPDGRVPYRSEAAARRKQHAYDRDHPTRPEHIDTQQRCLYAPPRMAYGTEQYRLIQPPGYIVFVYNRNHEYRVVPVAPEHYPTPGPRLKTWMGFSRGRWEGNTLVIENVNHRGILLTSLGDFVTDKTRFTERYQFIDADTINWEVTIDDPSVFTRPWTMRVPHKRGKDIQGNQGGEGAGDEFWEEPCWEGTSEVEHKLFDNLFGRKGASR